MMKNLKPADLAKAMDNISPEMMDMVQSMGKDSYFNNNYVLILDFINPRTQFSINYLLIYIVKKIFS